MKHIPCFFYPLINVDIVVYDGTSRVRELERKLLHLVTSRRAIRLSCKQAADPLRSLRFGKIIFRQIYCFDSKQMDAFARRTPELRAAHRQIRCILGVARFDSDLLHCGARLLLGL